MSKEDQQAKTYNAIVARCRDLIPPIDIEKHIQPGTLKINALQLDGIEFDAVDPDALEAELGGRVKIDGAKPLSAGTETTRTSVPGLPSMTFNMPNSIPVQPSMNVDVTRGPRSPNASMISMKEDPNHWALAASFGATVGVGFREQWRAVPEIGVGLPKLNEPKYGKTDPYALGFGETGKHLKFTALHAAVAPPSPNWKKRGCNLHIDERGFVVNLPYGAVVTATSWSHIANELLLKTKFRDWLDQKIGDNWLGGLVVEAVNRLNLRFSDAENGFAGASSRINSMKGVTDFGKAFMPIGVSYDLLKFQDSTVQFNYYNYDGQKTLTLSWGGTFDVAGSK